jgi:hypothetical protein
MAVRLYIQRLHRRVKFDGLKTPKVEEEEPHALEVDKEEAPPPEAEDSAPQQRAVGLAISLPAFGWFRLLFPSFSLSVFFFSIARLFSI